MQISVGEAFRMMRTWADSVKVAKPEGRVGRVTFNWWIAPSELVRCNIQYFHFGRNSLVFNYPCSLQYYFESNIG